MFIIVGFNTQNTKPAPNYFCPVNPKDYSIKTIQDSINNFIDDQIKVINNPTFSGKIFHVRLQYHYCNYSSTEDINSLNKICNQLLPKIKKRYKEIKSVDITMKGLKITDEVIVTGESCEKYVGIQLNLLTDG